MALTKYAEAPPEAARVLSALEHEKIEAELHRLGKTSAKSLSPEERQRTLNNE